MTVLPGIPAEGAQSLETLGAESFESVGERLIHRLRLGALNSESFVPLLGPEPSDPKSAWWRSFLEGEVPVAHDSRGGRLRTVDLFCGPGGLAGGVRQLMRELGVSVTTELAADQDREATDVYAANHGARVRSNESISALVDFRIKGAAERAAFVYEPELVSTELNNALIGTHMLLAGPPCQGHSTLNNQTRHDDRRNALYLTVPAFAIAADIPIVVIENVPAVVRDTSQVVETTRTLLEAAGYTVEAGVLAARHMGWPQSRQRHFLIARRDVAPYPLETVSELLRDETERSLWWAIGDLEDSVGDHALNQPTELSDENVARVNWLFDNDEHDLALSERPESHRGGTTYMSVYGRMRPDEPSPTITTGFMTPGRGRYVHPTRKRVLTAHEAARLQGFPDTYEFVTDPENPPAKAKLTKWIGDAVPMPLGYAAAISALAGGLPF